MDKGNLPIDSKRLRYFQVTARYGSFTKAEEVLGVAQPAISRQVQMLEKELGVVLFERNGRGVRLTDVGSQVFERASNVLCALSELKDAAAASRVGADGRVRLGLIPTVASNHAVELINLLSERFPKIELKIREGPTGIVHNWLAEDEVDVAILVGPSGHPAFAEQELLSETLYLVGASEIEPLQLACCEFAALESMPLVLPDSHNGARRLLDQMAARMKFRLNPLLEIDSLVVVKQLLLARPPLFTVLPYIACAREVADGLLAAVPIAPTLKRTLTLAVRNDRPQPRAVRETAQVLARIIAARDSMRGAATLGEA